MMTEVLTESERVEARRIIAAVEEEKRARALQAERKIAARRQAIKAAVPWILFGSGVVSGVLTAAVFQGLHGFMVALTVAFIISAVAVAASRS